jgi:hypothetical protein
MAAEVKGALGFGLSHHYVAAGAIWTIVPVTWPFVVGTNPKFKGSIDLVTHV